MMQAHWFLLTYGINEAVLFINDVYVSGYTTYEKAIAVIGESDSA